MGISHAKDFCEGTHDAGIEKWVSNFDVFRGAGRNKEHNKNVVKNIMKNIKLFFSFYVV